MKIIEREMNIFEQFIQAMNDAESRGKRIAEVDLTKAEYDEFRTLAAEGLNTSETMTLMGKNKIFGITLNVVPDEPKKVVQAPVRGKKSEK